MIKRILAFQLVCLLVSNAVEASSEHLDLARRLVEVTQDTANARQSIDTLVPKFVDLALSNNPEHTDDNKIKIEELVTQEVDAAWRENMEQNATIFAENLTVDELQRAINFHESTAGKKYLNIIQVELGKQSRLFGENLLQRILDRVKADIDP